MTGSADSRSIFAKVHVLLWVLSAMIILGSMWVFVGTLSRRWSGNSRRYALLHSIWCIGRKFLLRCSHPPRCFYSIGRLGTRILAVDFVCAVGTWAKRADLQLMWNYDHDKDDNQHLRSREIDSYWMIPCIFYHWMSQKSCNKFHFDSSFLCRIWVESYLVLNWVQKHLSRRISLHADHGDPTLNH